MTDAEATALKYVLTTLVLALLVGVIVWVVEGLTGPKPPRSEDDL